MTELEKLSTPAGIVLNDLKPIEIKTVSDIEKGMQIISSCVKSRTSFAAQIKPIKQKIDEYKKSILDFEKSENQKAYEIENAQEKNISDFKKEIMQIRNNIQTIYNDSMKNISIALADAKTNYSKFESLLEKWKTPKKKKAPPEIVVKYEPQIQEPVEIKFTDKQAKIKEKTVYEIGNEKEVIEWALKNNTEILKINVLISEFNRLPDSIKSNIPGVIQKTTY